MPSGLSWAAHLAQEPLGRDGVFARQALQCEGLRSQVEALTMQVQTLIAELRSRPTTAEVAQLRMELKKARAELEVRPNLQEHWELGSELRQMREASGASKGLVHRGEREVEALVAELLRTQDGSMHMESRCREMQRAELAASAELAAALRSSTRVERSELSAVRLTAELRQELKDAEAGLLRLRADAVCEAVAASVAQQRLREDLRSAEKGLSECRAQELTARLAELELREELRDAVARSECVRAWPRSASPGPRAPLILWAGPSAEPRRVCVPRPPQSPHASAVPTPRYQVQRPGSPAQSPRTLYLPSSLGRRATGCEGSRLRRP